MKAMFSKTAPDTARMTEICGHVGAFKVPHAAEMDGISDLDRVGWCHDNAIYQIATIELIEYLHQKIRGRPAIEICAGHGVIGRALKIPRTDSYVQSNEHRDIYKSLNTPVTNPPPDVKKMEALQAVKKYKPQVVIACWGTQKWKPGDRQASGAGVEEDKILRQMSVQMYIHVGNYAAHGEKRILDLPHEEEQYPWLVSRAFEQEQNVIFIWGK